ncbi:hypothetical protein CONPUDRAFT_166436 [Coniophora puteana RWD-64-598 SS2]|uniref:Uncharacterized protein n=1 Tax=Coniophora puteana (strain RWD-64-598) TaxID=741705 RepID=A0A5M3ML26_CONPW|nr:uncharacterized protein CONPUDRAFT_166436 [Coniophora puteana RWD-64-598 SS2]EIW79717.1 hypothetical protein CONPUDRAFT_166436 [Coniophora puteana RWD-64-598 SS2]
MRAFTPALALAFVATVFSGMAIATPLEDAALAYKIDGCGTVGGQLPAGCNGGGTKGCKCSGIGVYGCTEAEDTKTCKSKGCSLNIFLNRKRHLILLRSFMFDQPYVS